MKSISAYSEKVLSFRIRGSYMALRQSSTLNDVLLTVYTIQISRLCDSLSKKRILFLKSCPLEDRRLFLFMVELVISADGEGLLAAQRSRGEKRPKGRENIYVQIPLSS